MDNHGIENAIRPLAVGRKNDLFCGIHLILDLSRVCFMDCAMIRFLFTLNQLLRKRNSSLSIAHPNRFVELLIDTLKIEKFIPIIQKEHSKNRKI